MAPTPGLPPRANSTASATSTISTRHAQQQQPHPHVLLPDQQATLVRFTSGGTTTSQLTIDSQGDASSAADSNSMARPVAFAESRDVSGSSRDSLRRQVFRRRMSLTVQEQSFLDELVVHGNEVEVQLAFERLQDDDLFFDHQTPKQSRYHENGFDEKCDKEDLDSEPREDPSIGGDRPTLKDAKTALGGSLRRIAVLEQRKKCNQQAQLWKAHKSGLAVTAGGSRLSLMRRSSSIGSLSTMGSVRRPPSDIFRPVPAKRSSTNRVMSGVPIPRRPGRPYQRSSSLLVPSIPSPPGAMPRRASTTSSRKSVTFHEKTDGTPKPRPKTLKALRRSASDNILPALGSGDQQTAGHPPLITREESTSSIPSIRPAHPVRSDSINSIPSLHHGTPIRSDSIGSIPSLHHGAPIRSESIGSIPSLHHGTPIRQESIGSLPSLHHAHPIRQESLGSVPSLHPTAPIRSDSTNTIPSLHHGHPLDDSSLRLPSQADQDEQDFKAILMQQYAASDDIASAWLQQQHQNQQVVPPPIQDSKMILPPSSQLMDTEMSKPVLMRMASANLDAGEGIEVSDWDDYALANENDDGGISEAFPSVISLDSGIQTSNSFDTMQSYRHPEIFRGLRRALSDDDMDAIFLGPTAVNLLRETSTSTSRKAVSAQDIDKDEDDSSWDMNSETEVQRFDSWNVLKDEYVNGYGGGDTLGFKILGTDADDLSAHPHVLSPPLMESLQAFMPFSITGQNYYLKYSMVRNGASLPSFLKRARGVQFAILAIETLDGEVFGAFTGQPWRKNWNYFGTGESFLWRMRRSRLEKTHGILEQAQLESEVDVFPYTGENQLIQLCTHDRIALGGGTPSEKKTDDDDAEDPVIRPQDWGFGLAIANDFMTGTSSPCVTFGSPSLSKLHPNGNIFEIANMELWTLTPCTTVEDAEKLELGKLFLQRD